MDEYEYGSLKSYGGLDEVLYGRHDGIIERLGQGLTPTRSHGTSGVDSILRREKH